MNNNPLQKVEEVLVFPERVQVELEYFVQLEVVHLFEIADVHGILADRLHGLDDIRVVADDLDPKIAGLVVVALEIEFFALDFHAKRVRRVVQSLHRLDVLQPDSNAVARTAPTDFQIQQTELENDALLHIFALDFCTLNKYKNSLITLDLALFDRIGLVDGDLPPGDIRVVVQEIQVVEVAVVQVLLRLRVQLPERRLFGNFGQNELPLDAFELLHHLADFLQVLVVGKASHSDGRLAVLALG